MPDTLLSTVHLTLFNIHKHPELYTYGLKKKETRRYYITFPKSEWQHILKANIKTTSSTPKPLF